MKTVYDEVYFYVILITFNGESNFPQFSHCEKSAFDDTKIIAYYKTSIHHFTAFLRQKEKKFSKVISSQRMKIVWWNLYWQKWHHCFDQQLSKMFVTKKDMTKGNLGFYLLVTKRRYSRHLLVLIRKTFHTLVRRYKNMH